MMWFVALLRAVNVGGTGKLAMSELRAICEDAGLDAVQTYIASGNVVFRSDLDEAAIKAALQDRLATGILVRTGPELAEILDANPFRQAPGNRVTVIFLDEPASPGLLDQVTGRADDEQLRIGRREIYVHYGSGIGASKLRIPAAARGTARNINTVARLAAMACG
ncbi:DUF1697 domain-containing protein [Lichenicola sp.]|uniref:DUF1697 domain-containing protein n=1 Tax=Lichenicola sp. TaxID=2804529 RepID=UPI003B006459